MTDTANEIATGTRRPVGAHEVDATPVARGLKLPG